MLIIQRAKITRQIFKRCTFTERTAHFHLGGNPVFYSAIKLKAKRVMESDRGIGLVNSHQRRLRLYISRFFAEIVQQCAFQT